MFFVDDLDAPLTRSPLTRYGAVIRGPSAYVPPGARKASAVGRLPTPANGGSPAPSPAPTETATPPVAAPSPVSVTG